MAHIRLSQSSLTQFPVHFICVYTDTTYSKTTWWHLVTIEHFEIQMYFQFKMAAQIEWTYDITIICNHNTKHMKEMMGAMLLNFLLVIS